MGSRPTLAVEELVDVRRAAALTGRHPETVRRWVWSGRLPARKRGNKLLIRIADLEAIGTGERRPPMSLAAWTERVRRARSAKRRSGRRRSAADLIVDDRVKRSETAETDAGR